MFQGYENYCFKYNSIGNLCLGTAWLVIDCGQNAARHCSKLFLFLTNVKLYHFLTNVTEEKGQLNSLNYVFRSVCKLNNYFKLKYKRTSIVQ
jgi:hypothetical protein